MKAHVEILIRLHLEESGTLHDVLRSFACETRGWQFPEKESKTYQDHIDHAGGYVICGSVKGCEPAVVAVASEKPKRPNTFFVPNIVPQRCSQLTIDQYNEIGLAFVRDFRGWLKKSTFDGSVRCTNADKTLADIIPGVKCHGFLEGYLESSIWDSNALPSHPADIEKLDVFICAVFRYGAEVRSDEIERYLVTDKKWKPGDAAWVRNRINTGLDVLKVNRRF